MSEDYDWSPYRQLGIYGFSNSGKPINVSCPSLRHDGRIGVQDSKHLFDNLTEVAESQDSHPMVVYREDLEAIKKTNLSKAVEKSWTRLSGSSVWLQEYGIFLTVTRVIFYNGGSRFAPPISFLRSQVYDAEWNHLDKHTIKWQGNEITFPMVHEVGADYEKGGCFYGPEDPRIIIEEGVKGAEPVIVFNMVTKKSDWRRAMWIFRPFSRHAQMLTIRGQERGNVEKNWAPLFLSSPVHSSKGPRLPSQHIHLVYHFSPLRVLYCDLRTGDCDMAFTQTVHDGFKTSHSGDQARMRGGTNFVPMPLRGIAASAPMYAWVAFPRTNIDAGCDGSGVYRPMLTVLVNIGSQFFLSYVSAPMDFGGAAFTTNTDEDGCDTGRILIANSVARWDHSGSQDVMTVTLSVDDSTVQVIRLTGILPYLEGQSWMEELLAEDDLGVASENYLRNMEFSAAANDVQHCAVEAATNYTKIIETSHRLKKQVDEELRMKKQQEMEAYTHEEEDKQNRAKEQLEKEKLEREKSEKDAQEKEKEEKERQETEKQEKEKQQKEKEKAIQVAEAEELKRKELEDKKAPEKEILPDQLVTKDFIDTPS